jgi:uncharacterized protein
MQEKNIQPWFRQFWFWYLMAPLFVVVIVVGILMTVAFYHADDVVIDNYYKKGRMINQTFEQDLRAAELGLVAQLRFDRDLGDVMLDITDAEGLPDSLLLLLDHPVSANRDQRIVLRQLRPGFYRGDLGIRPEHHWYLALYPELDQAQRRSAEWRLSGEIHFADAEQAVLKPRASH